MKRVLLALIASVMLVSCGSFSKRAKAVETKNEMIEAAITLDSLLHTAENLVDQEVVIKGAVTHVCRHSGRRCFLIGDDQVTTLRVEAKGEIGGFNRELVGSELAIKGIVKETKLTDEYIAEWEKKVNEKKGTGEEDCGTEAQNIERMRDWMKKNNKNYYSLYYLDGESFEVIE